jgi:NTE family protein
MRQNSQLPNRDKGPRIALVLSGGGARGYAHIGVLEALVDAGITFTEIAGCSMGAIVGAHFAQFVDVKKLDHDAARISRENPFPIKDIIRRKAGIVSGEHAMTILTDIFGSIRFQDLKIPLSINAYDLHNSKEIVFRSGPVIDALRCSMSIPVFFDPIIKGDQIIVDGGVHNNFPFSLLDPDAYDYIIGVNVNQYIHPTTPDKLGFLNMIALTQHTIIRQLTHPQREKFKAMPNSILIEPDLGKYTAYQFKTYNEIRDIGYKTAQKSIPQIQNMIQGEGN